MTEQETEAQTRTRSALGGFERDAKTFQGHLERITGSAEAFVRRCAKFALQEPGHPRLAETAELLAEAKRIIGQDGPAAPAPVAVQALADSDAYPDLTDLQMAVTALARLALSDDGLGLGDAEAALSCLRAWLGPLAPAAPVHPVATGGLVAPAPVGEGDPHAGTRELLQREQERIQAALDNAAKAANPLAGALAAMAPAKAPVNPFAAFAALAAQQQP